MKHPCRLALVFLCVTLVVWSLAPTIDQAQQLPARVRIVSPIDDAQVVPLHGNTHPLARPEYDRGPAPDNLPARRMLLLLSRTAEQQSALDQFLEDQQSPGSPNYRRWLTPAEFGSMFGPADADVQTVAGWLQRHGFNVGHISAGKTVIEFSGSAGQVREAFHTQLHKYMVNGEERWANAQDPQVPAALAPVVRGLVSLNNFRPKRQLRRNGVFVREADGTVRPDITVTSNSNGATLYVIGPADFATIYGSNNLLQSGKNGTGETIAVLGLSNVHLQDVSDFRSFLGLPAGKTSVVLDGPDPGIVPVDETESILDLEWTGAVAPGANVVLVSAEATETTNGLFLAALHVIENNLADVMSLSYSECEAQLGVAGSRFVQSLWEQAAAQGITVVISSGDDGSAGCDSQNSELTASQGLGVNGFASTAFNVAVGGTDFDDAGTQSTYWNSTNLSGNLLSAKSYIPETTWNATCAATATAGNLSVCPALHASGTPPASLNLFAGSGGVSSLVPKPSWQTGTGVPQDGFRDLPDVSLFAGTGGNSKSFYVLCEADVLPAGDPSCQLSNGSAYFLAASGTSVSAQAFAGIVALAAQNAGTRLGNLNYFLYSIAAGNGASCPSASGFPGAGCVFNDITKGNISVPCDPGTPNCGSGSGSGVMVTATNDPAYAAGTGYDLATGLGSVNASNLANAIAIARSAAAATTTTLSLNSSKNPLNVQHGTPVAIAVNVTPSNASGDVALIGNNALSSFSGIDFNNSLSGGAANWSSSLFPGGTYTVEAHYAGDGNHQSSDSNGISVNITAEPSNTFVNLVSFDPSTGITNNFTATSVAYGSPYILRVDVTNSGGSVSPRTGANSTCMNGTASCPTGTATVTYTTPSLPVAQFLDGGSFPLNSKGFAEDQPIQLSAGNYTISASFPGDASYNASKGSTAVTVTKASTTLTANAAQSATYFYGTPVPINAQVSTTSSGAGPSGTLAVNDNGASSLSAALSPSPGSAKGFATATWNGNYLPPSVGTHTLIVQYNGDQNYNGSVAGPISFTISKANVSVGTVSGLPIVAGTSSLINLSVQMCSSSQLNAPTGAVTFSDNGAPISATVNVLPITGTPGCGGHVVSGFNAQAAFTLAQVGSHAITISYAGDVNYNSASSQNVGTVTVVSTPLAIVLPPGANQATLPSTGGTGGTSITVANLTSTAMGVSLTCTPDSTAALCSVIPPTVNVPANGLTQTTVSYTVPPLTGQLQPILPFGAPFVFAGVLLGFTCMNRKRRAVAFLLLATAVGMSMTSCGGGSSSHSSTPTPSAKVYNFTITATSGSNSDSKTITVTVE
jgi:subtilase family serine protease